MAQVGLCPCLLPPCPPRPTGHWALCHTLSTRKESLGAMSRAEPLPRKPVAPPCLPAPMWRPQEFALLRHRAQCGPRVFRVDSLGCIFKLFSPTLRGKGHCFSLPLSDRFLGREFEPSVSLQKYSQRRVPPAPTQISAQDPWAPNRKGVGQGEGIHLGRGRRIRVLPSLPTAPGGYDGVAEFPFLCLWACDHEGGSQDPKSTEVSSFLLSSPGGASENVTTWRIFTALEISFSNNRWPFLQDLYDNMSLYKVLSPEYMSLMWSGMVRSQFRDFRVPPPLAPLWRVESGDPKGRSQIFPCFSFPKQLQNELLFYFVLFLIYRLSKPWPLGCRHVN